MTDRIRLALEKARREYKNDYSADELLAALDVIEAAHSQGHGPWAVHDGDCELCSALKAWATAVLGGES